MQYPPTLLHSSRIFYLKKQFSAETMFFFGKIFTFLKKYIIIMETLNI